MITAPVAAAVPLRNFRRLIGFIGNDIVVGLLAETASEVKYINPGLQATCCVTGIGRPSDFILFT